MFREVSNNSLKNTRVFGEIDSNISSNTPSNTPSNKIEVKPTLAPLFLIDCNINTEEYEENLLEAIHNDIDFDEPNMDELTDNDIFVHELLNQVEIGRGSFGIVYSGIFNETEPGVMKSTKLGEGKKEAAKLKELASQYVPEFYGIKEDGKKLQIFMEKIEGDVSDLIKNGYFVDNEEKSKDFVKQILEALAHFEQQHFAHCDLKPDNIGYVNVNNKKEFKMLDLGSASKMNDNGICIPGVSTLVFQATERIGSNEKTFDGHKLDIYSVGGIIYNIFTGKSPYSEIEGGAATKADSVERELWIYSQENTHYEIPKDIPNFFQNIMHECWESDPNTRKTAIDLLNMYF